MTKPNRIERDLLDLVLRNGARGNSNAFISNSWLAAGSGAGSTNCYIHLFKAGLAESATNVSDGSEADYGNYAAEAVVRGNNNWDSLGGGLFANGNTSNFTFPQASSANTPQTLTHWAVASSNGSIFYSGPLTDSDPQPFVMESSDDVVRVINHGHSSNDQIILIALPNVTFPSGGGMVSNTLLYARDVSNDGLKVATSSGGAAINVTASGAGLIAGMNAQAISENNTPRFVTNALRITED